MVERFGLSSQIGLLACLCSLGACGVSSGPSADENASAPVATPSVTAPSPPVSVPTPAVIDQGGYDASIGVGVDANGFADLPLRAGAHRYFVNSATGNDGNGCSAAQQPATPLKTITAGKNCMAAWGNAGDQLLVAEGTRYSENLPNVDALGGYSAAYPTVFQSYNPADPLNESSYGRASGGRRPVINTGATAVSITCCATNPASYVVFRGFDFNPGNVPDMGLSIVGSNKLPNNYFLLENNIFRYTSVGFNESVATTRAQHIIVRKNAFFGQWSTTGHSQGLFISGMTGATVEDNVFYHVGWKLGVSRDTDPSIGGPTMFRHSVYQQVDADAVIRRNIFMDSSATGCSCRGDTTISENVFIDNPISIIGGLGDSYDTYRPNGVAIDIGYNAILGDADINSINPRGMAILTGNGKQGSSAHHNLIVRSRNVDGTNVYAFATQTNYNQPSYMNYDSNLVYRFSTPTFSSGGTFPAQDFPIYTNNIWDAASSGTNKNNAGTALPNPLGPTELYAALGCTDKQTCAALMIETPEVGWGVKVRALLWQGYGR
jgi:hypothetical protein